MPGRNTAGTANTNDYNLGRGKVYFADLVSSKPNAYRFLGNAPEFNISVEVETLEHESSQSGLKVTDKEVVISQKVNLNLTLDELNFENLSTFLAGTTSSFTNGGAETGYDLAGAESYAVADGRWYDIVDSSGKRVYNLATLADNSGTAGTHYSVDLKMGRIFLIDSATADLTDVTWTVDSGAATFDEVRALTQTSILGALKFVAENPASTDHQTEFQFHQVSLKAEGDLGMISDEYSQMQLTGIAERNTTADADSPTLTIRTHSAA